MKPVIDRFFFNRVGFNVYRYDKSNPFSPRVVDMIGPPGIGKTSILRSMIEKSIIHSDKKKFDKVKRVCASRARLLSLAAVSLDDLEILQRKALKLLYDLNMSDCREILLVDEGISHHFTSELCELFRINKEGFERIMQRRAIVNLTAPPELITRRIRHRSERNGGLLSFHREKSDKELNEFNIEAMKIRETLTALMKEVGFPTLTVDMLREESTVVECIEEFLSSL